MVGWCQAINEYFIHNPPSTRSSLVVTAYTRTFIFYIIGTLLYTFKIPECFYPGGFDYIGNSHNLFHIFIAIGAFVHYNNILTYQEEMTNCLSTSTGDVGSFPQPKGLVI